MSHLAAAALDMQVDLERFTKSKLGLRLTRAMSSFQPLGDETPSIEATHGSQIVPLTFGETFAVSVDVCQLLEGAARSLPEFTVHESDVPAKWGFVYLEEPLLLHDDTEFSRPIIVKAIGWATAGATGTKGDDEFTIPNYGVAISIWTDPRDPRDHMAAEVPNHEILPPLFFLSYQAHQWDTSLAVGRDKMNAHILRWLYSLWRFVQEPFIDGRAILPGRPAMKRAIRAGRPTAEVKVVRLRKRSQSRHDPENPLDDDDILWSHRWLVKGHWRNQWYPSQDRHAPKWISGYVKGPEHLPLLVKDTVFQVDR